MKTSSSDLSKTFKAKAKAAAKKPEPKVQVTVLFGALNQISFDLPHKEFATMPLVKAEVKRRHKSATKAFVTFPGDEFAESLTFTPKVKKTATPDAAPVQV